MPMIMRSNVRCFTELATVKPKFITTLSDKTVREGQALCLECDVAEAETVTWLKDGVIQRNNADFKQSFDGRRAKLEIVEVFLDDYGMYTCVVKNSFAENKCSCQIIVKGNRFN